MADQLAGKRTKVRPALVGASFITALAEALEKAETQDGKAPRLALVEPDFIVDMARVMENGLLKDGRYPGCWKEIDHATAAEFYPNAAMRHVLEQLSALENGLTELVKDPESKQDVLVHVATSVMILRYHVRKLQEKKE